MKLGKIVIYAINFLLIGLLLSRVMIVNNSKSPGFFFMGYGLLVGLNNMIWGILSIFKAKISTQFARLIIVLLTLFLPLLFLVIVW